KARVIAVSLIDSKEALSKPPSTTCASFHKIGCAWRASDFSRHRFSKDLGHFVGFAANHAQARMLT
ncbi:MAG: hypothetical protein P8L17_03570, partial [Methylophilaceae bacterium]|nr:hypothetical protein [Methylophilaceae bacterium]